MWMHRSWMSLEIMKEPISYQEPRQTDLTTTVTRISSYNFIVNTHSKYLECKTYICPYMSIHTSKTLFSTLSIIGISFNFKSDNRVYQQFISGSLMQLLALVALGIIRLLELWAVWWPHNATSPPAVSCLAQCQQPDWATQ